MTKEKAASRRRADLLLLERGLAATCHKAQALIMAGEVFSGAERVEKPGQLMPLDRPLAVREAMPFAGRGGLKLAEALDAFGISVDGLVAADLGASTGGFTDCLLQRGARIVYAIDVDTKQLDFRLRKDPRVVLLEKNARYLSPADFPEPPEVVTADLSFISIIKVLPALKPILGSAILLALLKPQFEAGRTQVGKKGIIRDPEVHAQVLGRVVGQARELGFTVRGLMKCATRGQKGNQEFIVWWSLLGPGLDPEGIPQLIREVTGHENH